MSFSFARPAPGSRKEITIGALAITILLALAYANSFSGPFIFDDVDSIVENPTIRHWTTALTPPTNSGITVSGRPLLNFSFAVNYAISGTKVWSYHAGNFLIHLTSALTLFGIVRRTLLRRPLASRFGSEATLLAGTAALLWGVHPLTTAAVTYVVQRAESLTSLCYLLTLYGFIRATTPGGGRFWLVFSIFFCFLGMAGKEIMVTAPALVLLYDGLFVAPDWRQAVRQRWRYYLALAASWLLLAFLIRLTGNRGGTAGMVDSLPWWAYVLTQCEAMVQYLALSFIPIPLTFDYGVYVVTDGRDIWLPALLLVILASAALLALRQRHPAAFPLPWFFLILAPTSSVIPIASQTVAEHRMYLPLAGVIVLLVLALRLWLKKWSYPVFALWAVALAGLTLQRNFVYQSEWKIWQATVSSRPENSRAWLVLGHLYYQEGRLDEAMKCYDQALLLLPDTPEFLCKLGASMYRAGRYEPAIALFRKALARDPRRTEAYRLLAEGLRHVGRPAEAEDALAEARRLESARP